MLGWFKVAFETAFDNFSLSISFSELGTSAGRGTFMAWPSAVWAVPVGAKGEEEKEEKEG